MSKEEQARKVLEELSEIHDKVSKLVEEYNTKASGAEVYSRLGVASASIDIEDTGQYEDAICEHADTLGKMYDDLTEEEIEDFDKEFFKDFEIDEYIQDLGYSVAGIDAPGCGYAWFPSSIC